MKRIFDKLEFERSQNNEYNRTKIYDRTEELERHRFKFDINRSHGLRILETSDSTTKQNSYFNRLAKNNQEHIKRTIN